jgi:hypothetical protein
MRPDPRALVLFVAALAGCGKDPFAGKKQNNDGKHAPIDSVVLETDGEKFDRELVGAYERLVAARASRDTGAWKAAFVAAPGEEAESLYTESTDPKVAKIHHQFQKADADGDRATMTVKEIIEERDPKGNVLNSEVIVTATLVKSGGAWKVEALKADWK